VKEKITKNMNSSGAITQLAVQDQQSSVPVDPEQTTELKIKRIPVNNKPVIYSPLSGAANVS
jgi:hypothetical protein